MAMHEPERPPPAYFLRQVLEVGVRLRPPAAVGDQE